MVQNYRRFYWTKLLVVAVKEIFNSVDKCRSYRKMKVVRFFLWDTLYYLQWFTIELCRRTKLEGDRTTLTTTQSTGWRTWRRHYSIHEMKLRLWRMIVCDGIQYMRLLQQQLQSYNHSQCDVIDSVVRWRYAFWLVVAVQLKDDRFRFDVFYERLGHCHRHLPHSTELFDRQWLKCNKRKRTPFPHLKFFSQSVRSPQIVTMLGTGTWPLSGGLNLNVPCHQDCSLTTVNKKYTFSTKYASISFKNLL